MIDIYAFLHQHHIPYNRQDHPPVYTTEQAERLVPPLPGIHTKNLFLRDKKGKRYFLLMIESSKELDLKNLAAQIETSRLSLASPRRLIQYLGIEPGAVSLLALVNDPEHNVEILIDRNIWNKDALHCHPLVNTTTLVISLAGIRSFLTATGHTYHLVDIPVNRD
ncbi:MAG: prolyl-tRNA synthetase associated domain-containing protein [Anaerolineales bacterium]|jgi:Ala-tRNA(Pro) deacylase